MQRQIFEIEVKEPLEYDEGNGDDEIKISLKKMISRLTERLGEIPAEFQDDAVLKIRGCGEYVSIYLDIYYPKPETDEELAARKLEDEKRQQIRKRLQEQDERDQYERLKKKFEL